MGPSARRRGCTWAQLPIELQELPSPLRATILHGPKGSRGWAGDFPDKSDFWLPGLQQTDYSSTYKTAFFSLTLLKGRKNHWGKEGPPRKHKPTARVPQHLGPCPLLLGMMRDSISFLFVAAHLLSFTDNAYVLIHTTTWWNLSQTLSGQLATHLAG